MSTIFLRKGEPISLAKEAPGLKKIIIGLGWDTKLGNSGFDFDLDASCFMLNKEEKILTDKHFIFYNNKKSPDGSVNHMGDDRTGGGSLGLEEDDEQIKVELSKVAKDVEKVLFVVTIHDADNRKQNFGQVRKAYIRLVDEENNKEIARYNLAEDYSGETAMLMSELYRNNGEWRFKALGVGYNGGLQPIVARFYDGDVQ